MERVPFENSTFQNHSNKEGKDFYLASSPETTLDHFSASEMVAMPICACALSHARLCAPAGCSVHGILQARALEWAAISSSRGPS